MSSRVLQPDLEYINELIDLIEEQRSFRKDREAVKLTVIRCCDAVELAKIAPPFLQALSKISSQSSKQEIENALTKFAFSLYSTRNSFSHAKANYQLTGTECPQGELEIFSKCAKLAAEQVIRWYQAQPAHMRVG